MIERVLHSVLSAGVAAILADLSWLDAVFQPEGTKARITDVELAKIKVDFTAKPPRVRHGYVTDHADLPCYTIILATDEPDTRFLGGLAQMDDTDPAVEVIGCVETRRYDLLVLGRTPDETLWFYKILKNLVLSNYATLRDYDVLLTTYSGRELDPVRENLPEFVFRRVLSLTVRVEEYVSLVPLPRYTGGTEVLRDTVGGGVSPVAA